MSEISYNSVTLPYSHITQFNMEAQYDDQGQTDWYLTKYNLKCQTVINADYLAAIAPRLIGTTSSPAGAMKAIRKALMTARKTLSVKFNGTELIPQPNPNDIGTVDAANGPQPQSCTYHELTNTTFLMTYHIVANYWEKLTNNLPTDVNQHGSPVLYNRWAETVDMDIRQMSKRIRDGKFVIRSDNAFGQTIDNFRRQMAVVGVPPGFLRTNSSWTVDPSGLGIRYHVEDTEVFRMPPNPAYEAKGTYTEFFTDVGAMRHGRVVLALGAAKTVPQNQLVMTAIRLAAAKMWISSGAQGISILEDFRIDVSLYSNEVTVVMQGMFSANVRRLASIGLSNNITFAPGSDQTLTGQSPVPTGAGSRAVSRAIANFPAPTQPPYRVRGTADLLLQAAAYYDPSLANNAFVQSTGNMNNGIQPGQGGVNPDPGTT